MIGSSLFVVVEFYCDYLPCYSYTGEQ